MKKVIRPLVLAVLLFALALALSVPLAAAEDAEGAEATELAGLAEVLSGSDTLDIIYLMTVIVLVPSILVMTTCFTRIVVVLSLLRNALGLQQTPPNQVLIGTALFLTLFIMSPTIEQIRTDAYIPYKNEEITQEEMFERAVKPLRESMLRNTKAENLNFFLDVSGTERPESYDDIPTTVIIPAFITSELTRAFLMGFLLYLPFLVIDIVVASTLTSMGMVMLPPTLISMPFKLMLFVLVNGWQLTFQTLISGFN
ncbi:MAG TPA: flagellar type III secretion system pore protein FliP [Clostridiales bacterium]|nr:flagellar type III secretion system pore protein FliP [Clostridiales bacterium]